MSIRRRICARSRRFALAERAGYSERPLVEKLGIKPGQRIAIVAAPPDFAATIGKLPAGVRRARELRGAIDTIVCFAHGTAELTRRIASAKRAMVPAGMLWICWLKKTSALTTDLNENIVREIGLGAGLVDVKICAVDADWSGLKFVYRLRDRPKPATPRRARRTR
jgi:hypothetical protein